jgi:hypothetical protein
LIIQPQVKLRVARHAAPLQGESENRSVSTLRLIGVYDWGWDLGLLEVLHQISESVGVSLVLQGRRYLLVKLGHPSLHVALQGFERFLQATFRDKRC